MEMRTGCPKGNKGHKILGMSRIKRTSHAVLKELPELKRKLWAGEFWSDRYFARTAGDRVTTEIIKCYIQYHNSKRIAFDF
jgi:REP-associated tyrosine transposase